MPAPGAAPGTPGYTPNSKSYGVNKAAIGAGIGAGAGAGVLYLVMHNRGVYKGCVGLDGTTFTNEKDGRKLRLQASSVQPGERVSIKTKKAETDASGPTLEVVNVRRDFGPCEQRASSR